MKVLSSAVCLCAYTVAALAYNASEVLSEGPLLEDPFVKYRPAFARSLPVQILLTGIVLTLVSVLFIHLIFTAQYHWPLAPVNCVLQFSGVTTLLISLIATLHVVLSAAREESLKWPYMLSYIAVNVPPDDLGDNTGPGLNTKWSNAEQATWLVMNATTSGLIQITHIQFLTLLYPSRLEKRLIFSLLGPLAVAAAIVQLLPMSDNDSVLMIASAVKNVCNATLSLLFTAALFIWGLLVNRRQAWRTDGGTAAFGAAALALAIISTALNLLYIPRDEEFLWLPSLMWAVVLWQSFLGWWWWVGAGNGASSKAMEEVLKREEKRERRRREARERRRDTKEKAKVVLRGVAGAFVPKSPPQKLAARRTAIPSRNNSNSNPSTDDLSNPGPTSHDSSASASGGAPRGDSAAMSTITTSTAATLPSFLPGAVHRWYASLRRAHNAAARQQAVERAERIREMDVLEASPQAGAGWGLGSYGLRDSSRPASVSGRSRRWRKRDKVEGAGSGSGEEEEVGEEEDVVASGSDQSGSAGRRRRQSASRTRRARVVTSDEEVEVYEDEDGDVGGYEQEIVEEQRESRWQQGRYGHPPPPLSPPTEPSSERPRTIWYWGPLRRWRLQDSTVY